MAMSQSAKSLRVSALQFDRSPIPSTPGPELHKKIKVSTFGTSPRGNPFAPETTSPPPKYHIPTGIEICLHQNKGPSLGCSREETDKSNLSYRPRNMNPGPGAYHPKQHLPKRKVVIGPRNKAQTGTQNQTPGPKYQILSRRLAGGKIATLSDRFKRNKQNYPGPSTYCLHLEVKKTFNSSLSNPEPLSLQHSRCKQSRVGRMGNFPACMC